MKKNMRKVLVLVLALAMAIACAGCGDKETAGGNAAAETLKIAVMSEPDNLDPMLSAAADTEGMMRNVYEGLLSFNEQGEFIPALAESYKISDDGLTYTFKLREDIKFHDGNAFSAKDVKYTYEKLAGLGGNEPLSQTFADIIKSVETPDDYTVVLNLKHKDAGFLCRCIVSIVEKDYEDNATLPIGTGPYKFKEYIQGQKLILEKNDDYNTVESRIPEVQTVEFCVMTDPNAVLMALKSGDLDIATLDPANVDTVGEDYNVITHLQNVVQLMSLNNKVAPFDDIRVRQAVNYAVDKDEIIKTVTKGYGQKVESFLSPAMPAYFNDQIEGYPTNIEKAKQLLKEAGYEDGLKFTIKVPSNYKVHVDAAQVIKNQLAKAGIDAEIETIEWAQWLDQVYTKADYQATVVAQNGKLDPQDFLNRFTTSYARNYFNYSDPEYDKMVSDAALTTDDAKRAEIYKKCQQKLSDDAAAVYIQDVHLIYAVNKKFDNMIIYPVTFYDMGSIRLAK